MSIKIDLKIFLFLFLFFLTSQIEIYILLMIFACIHEIAHLITGILLKFKPKELKITPIGLQIRFYIKCNDYNQKIGKGNYLGIKKMIIALMGPITNFVIALILIMLKSKGIITINPNLYQNCIYANILIGLFNLIPIYPLDGGRILNEILHLIFGLKKSYYYTHIISKITIIMLTMTASIAILYLQNIAILIIIIYLWILAIKESNIYHTKEKIEEISENIEGVCGKSLQFK